MKRARPPGEPYDPDDEPTQPMPRLAFGSSPSLPRPRPRSTTHPDPAGFGDYLVAIGVLTHERLRAAQAYQRAVRVQLSTAIVTLGLASAERVELAAVAYQAERRDGA